MKPKYLASFLFLIFSMSCFGSARAWYNETVYPYRSFIYSNSSSRQVISVNDTFGISNDIIWAFINDDSYIYCSVSGCNSGIIAIANDTYEETWENETALYGHLSPNLWDLATWHFGQTSGTTIEDSSANNYDCTFSATGEFNSSGKFGVCGSFNASQNGADCGDLPFELMTQASFELWFNPDHSNSNPNNYLIAKGGGDNLWIEWDHTVDYDWPGHGLWTDSLIFMTKTWTGQHFCNNGIKAGQWHHVVAIWNGTYTYIYLNGTKCETEYAEAFPVPTDAVHLWLGDDKDHIANTKFIGRMDEVRIYNRTLTQNEVLAHYNTGINNMTRLGTEEEVTTTTTTTTSTTTTTTTTSTTTTTTTTPITTTIEITTTIGETTTLSTTYPPFMNITNFPSCCIVSRTYCVDNETIRQIWVVNNQTVQADALCDNGCDTVLNECRKSLIEEYSIYILIVIFILVFFGIILFLYRRT